MVRLMSDFRVGDRARPSSSGKEVTVRAYFRKNDGTFRYVVEHDDGSLDIVAPAELKPPRNAEAQTGGLVGTTSSITISGWSWPDFKVGDKVKVKNVDVEATVIGRCHKLDGQRRYVVETKEGSTIIFPPDNLEPAKCKECGRVR